MKRRIALEGGTSGVGRATAQRFAVEGGAIAILTRGADGLAEIESLGGTAIAERYLAHQGYEGQLTDVPDHHPAATLFDPVAGDHGAHGFFDDRARSHDPVARVATVLGAAGVNTVFAASVVLGRRARRRGVGAAEAAVSPAPNDRVCS